MHAQAVSPGRSRLAASLSDMPEAHEAVTGAIIEALRNVGMRTREDVGDNLPREITQEVIDGLGEPALLHVRRHGIQSAVVRTNLVGALSHKYSKEGIPELLQGLLVTAGNLQPYERRKPPTDAEYAQWNRAPAWARFRAMNADGLWRWHEDEPEFNHTHGIWTSSGRQALCIDPQASLERRPV